MELKFLKYKINNFFGWWWWWWWFSSTSVGTIKLLNRMFHISHILTYSWQTFQRGLADQQCCKWKPKSWCSSGKHLVLMETAPYGTTGWTTRHRVRVQARDQKDVLMMQIDSHQKYSVLSCWLMSLSCFVVLMMQIDSHQKYSVFSCPSDKCHFHV